MGLNRFLVLLLVFLLGLFGLVWWLVVGVWFRGVWLARMAGNKYSFGGAFRDIHSMESFWRWGATSAMTWRGGVDKMRKWCFFVSVWFDGGRVGHSCLLA